MMNARLSRAPIIKPDSFAVFELKGGFGGALAPVPLDSFVGLCGLLGLVALYLDKGYELRMN